MNNVLNDLITKINNTHNVESKYYVGNAIKASLMAYPSLISNLLPKNKRPNIANNLDNDVDKFEEFINYTHAKYLSGEYNLLNNLKPINKYKLLKQTSILKNKIGNILDNPKLDFIFDTTLKILIVTGVPVVIALYPIVNFSSNLKNWSDKKNTFDKIILNNKIKQLSTNLENSNYSKALKIIKFVDKYDFKIENESNIKEIIYKEFTKSFLTNINNNIKKIDTVVNKNVLQFISSVTNNWYYTKDKENLTLILDFLKLDNQNFSKSLNPLNIRQSALDELTESQLHILNYFASNKDNQTIINKLDDYLQNLPEFYINSFLNQYIASQNYPIYKDQDTINQFTDSLADFLSLCTNKSWYKNFIDQFEVFCKNSKNPIQIENIYKQAYLKMERRELESINKNNIKTKKNSL